MTHPSLTTQVLIIITMYPSIHPSTIRTPIRSYNTLIHPSTDILKEVLLDIPKKTVLCRDITSVELLDSRGDLTIRIKFAPTADATTTAQNDWVLKLPPLLPSSSSSSSLPAERKEMVRTMGSEKERSLMIKKQGLMWYRKIARCSIQVTDPTLIEAGNIKIKRNSMKSGKDREVKVREYKVHRQLKSISADAAVFSGATVRTVNHHPLPSSSSSSRRRSSTLSSFMGGMPMFKSK